MTIRILPTWADELRRRYLRGEIVIDTDGNIRGKPPEPEPLGEVAPEGEARGPVAGNEQRELDL